MENKKALEKYINWAKKHPIITIFVIIIIMIMISNIFPSGKPVEQGAPVSQTNSPTISKEEAQAELDRIVELGKQAGLIKSYEFSDMATVVYIGSTWYTQTVQLKKDFLAKIATLKETITGYQHFEVRDAYSNEKVAEVTAFSGSLEVYK